MFSEQEHGEKKKVEKGKLTIFFTTGVQSVEMKQTLQTSVFQS